MTRLTRWTVYTHGAPVVTWARDEAEACRNVRGARYAVVGVRS